MTKRTATATPALTLTVQGKQINQTIITAYAKRVGSLDDILSVWANAASLQMAIHGNNKWMVTLFEMPVMTLKSGGLSKTGKEVMDYITAHFPRAQFDKDSGKVGLTKLTKESILATHFVAVGVTQDSENVADFDQVRNKYYKPHGDFNLTLTQFRNLEKPEKEVEDKEPSMTAKAFVKQAEKALACFEADRFVGTPDELLAAACQAKALFLKLDAAFNAAEAAKLAKMQEAGTAHSATDVIDVALADQLHKSGQGGKALRAGGKVSKAAVGPEMAVA